MTSKKKYGKILEFYGVWAFYYSPNDVVILLL